MTELKTRVTKESEADVPKERTEEPNPSANKAENEPRRSEENPEFFVKKENPFTPRVVPETALEVPWEEVILT